VPQVRRGAGGSAQGRLHTQYGSKQFYTEERLEECLIARVFFGLNTFISLLRANIVFNIYFLQKQKTNNDRSDDIEEEITRLRDCEIDRVSCFRSYKGNDGMNCKGKMFL
jgi:hypothetical protein